MAGWTQCHAVVDVVTIATFIDRDNVVGVERSGHEDDPALLTLEAGAREDGLPPCSV